MYFFVTEPCHRRWKRSIAQKIAFDARSRDTRERAGTGFWKRRAPPRRLGRRRTAATPVRMVQLGGLEPPTFGATIRRSNQLSYSCMFFERAPYRGWRRAWQVPFGPIHKPADGRRRRPPRNGDAALRGGRRRFIPRGADREGDQAFLIASSDFSMASLAGLTVSPASLVATSWSSLACADSDSYC